MVAMNAGFIFSVDGTLFPLNQLFDDFPVDGEKESKIYTRI